LEQLDDLLEEKTFDTPSVFSKLTAASQFLHEGGRDVLITNIHQLPRAVSGESGLYIHN
jgi:carbamate kinase